MGLGAGMIPSSTGLRPRLRSAAPTGLRGLARDDLAVHGLAPDAIACRPYGPWRGDDPVGHGLAPEATVCRPTGLRAWRGDDRVVHELAPEHRPLPLRAYGPTG
jgi:hypothetical protein